MIMLSHRPTLSVLLPCRVRSHLCWYYHHPPLQSEPCSPHQFWTASHCRVFSACPIRRIVLRSACEDLLHASTPPQVETVRAYELAKCRGNERWPSSPPDRRDRSRSPRGRSTTRRPATAPSRYSLRQEWNLSLKKAKRILDTKTIRRAPALQSRAEPAL